jgi:hypothetical protein
MGAKIRSKNFLQATATKSIICYQISNYDC